MTAKDALEGIDEILDWFALHISTFGRLGKTDSETKQALYQQIIEIVGKDTYVGVKKAGYIRDIHGEEYSLTAIGASIEGQAKNELRAELRQKLRAYFGVTL